MEVLKTLSMDRVRRRLGQVLKALSSDSVQQRLVDQMMSMTSPVAPKSLLRIPAVSSRFPLVMKGKMRKMRWRRRRRRRSRWTLRSSPHASKAIFASGATVPPSSEVVSVGGARRALSRTRTTSPTQMYRDNGDGGSCDLQSEFQQFVLFFSLEVPQIQFMIRRVVTLVVDLQWHVQGWFCPLRCIFRCVRLACRQARDVRHHGFCGFQMWPSSTTAVVVYMASFGRSWVGALKFCSSPAWWFSSFEQRQVPRSELHRPWRLHS